MQFSFSFSIFTMYILGKFLPSRTEVKLPFNARLAFTLLCIILIIYIARLGHTLIIPLAFAMLVAIMLLPLASQLEKWRFSRGAAAFTVVLLFVILLVGV